MQLERTATHAARPLAHACMHESGYEGLSLIRLIKIRSTCIHHTMAPRCHARASRMHGACWVTRARRARHAPCTREARAWQRGAIV